MALNKNNQEAATREKVKSENNTREKKKRIRVRLIPIWLRIIIVIILLGLSIMLGAMFGYGVLGGRDASDVFEKSTWTHIKDLVSKE